MSAYCYVRTCNGSASQVVEVIFEKATEYGPETDYEYVFLCEDHERTGELSVNARADGHSNTWFHAEHEYSDLIGVDDEMLEITVSNIYPH